MKIQTMKQSDFKQVYALWKKAGLNVSDYQKEKKESVMMLTLNPYSCLVGIEDNKIIGSVFGIFNGRRGWIYHLAIDPTYQKMGNGTKLLKQAEYALFKQGAQRVLLWVEHSNLKVIPFYTKNKYEIIPDALVFGKNV